MTAEVEQRIVEMRFDNEQFEKGAKQTLSTLEKLDGILDMLGSGGGMDHLSSALDVMEHRFSRLGIAGAAAIENITNKVIGLASHILTAIPQQIMSGGEARAMNIEQARFQLKGLGVAWEELSDSIDYAVMGTAYGVDEAAKIASILVASKVDFKNVADGATDLGHALRGISGIAGMTNSSFEEIGNLMGDIFAMGKLSTRQLQSFELRGLNVAAKLAELSQNGQLRHLGDDAVYTEEQIRDLVSKGKIDALTFAKAMDLAFGEHATKANETYTGALRNLKASLSRIGEPFFTAWHEGLRKIFLQARQTFDRVKAIVKPFAEGRFTQVVNDMSDKVVKFLDNLDLQWLDKIVKFLEKSNAWTKPIDWAIKALNSSNEISKRLFSNWTGNEEKYNDPFHWVYDVRDRLKDVFATVEKAGNIFSKFFKSLNRGTYWQYFVSTLTDLVRYALPYVNRALDWFSAHSDSISNFIQNIITEGLNTIVIFEQVAGALVRFGISVLKLFGTILGKLFSGDRSKNIFDAYMEGAWKLSDSLTAGIDKLTAFVDKITEIIDKGPSAESALGKIANGFGIISSILKPTNKAADQAKRDLEQIQKEIADKGIDINKTVYGNIDTNNRQVLKWTADNLKKYEKALQSWGIDLADMADSISTVIGMSSNFDGLEIAFSPMLQTDHGAELLDSDTVYDYISRLLGELSTRPNGWNTEDLIALDARGLEIDGKHIKGLIADVGETAIKTGEAMHYTGKDGALALAEALVEVEQSGSKTTTVLGGIVGAISTFLSYILGLKEGETIFSKFGDTFKTVGETIRGAFGYIRTALQSFFGGEDGKQFIKNAAAVYTVILGYRNLESKKWAFGRMGRAFEFLKELITGTYEKIKAINPLEWADTIETLLKRTSGALRAFSDNLNAKSLITIGGAVVVLAVGLSILAAVAEGGHLGAAIGALAAVMGLLVGALWAIKTVTDQGLFKNITKGWKGLADIFKNSISKYFNAITLKETATAMLIFAAAVGVLSLAVVALGFAFSKLKLTDILLAVGTVAALTVLLSGMLIWITKATTAIGMLDSTKFFAFAAAFIGIAVAVGILSLAVAGLTYAFSKIDGDKFWAVIGSAVGAIVLFCTVLTGAVILLSKFAQDPMVLFAATAIVLIAAAIDILVLGLIGLTYVLNDLGEGGGGKLWNAIAMITALAVILGGLSVALSMFAPLALLAAPATVLIALALDLLILGLAGLAIAIDKLGGGKLWHAIGMIAALSVIFVVLMSVVGLLSPILAAAGGVFKIFSSVAKDLAEAFVGISEGMVVLAGALNMMPADGSLEIIAKGLGKIAGALVKIGLASMFMPNNGDEVFSALVPLGTALTVLEDIDIPKLADKKTGLPALSKALREAFGGHFFGLFGSLGTSMGAGSAGLLAAGPALAALGKGLQALGPGLEAFNNAGDLDFITEHLQALVYAVIDISDYGYDTTFKFMPQMAESLASIADSLNNLSADQIALVSSLGEALSGAFTDNSGAAVEALSTELEQLTTTLDTGSQQFIITARRIPTHIQSGIEDNTVIAVNAMKKLLWNIGSEANSEQQKQNWRTIGGNIAIGIANGISSRTQEATNAMRRLASALQTSFTVSLQIRSPSRLFEHLAEYVPQGVARGIQNGTPEITAAMAESMTGAMDVLDQYARQTGSMAPSISPVMNMADMRRDFSYMDQMFQRSGIGSFSGFSGLTVNGDAISYNMQNRDVVGELKQMSNKINRLGQAIENMQMVLDTGVLVGQLSPGINSELGIMAMREGRQ